VFAFAKGKFSHTRHAFSSPAAGAGG